MRWLYNMAKTIKMYHKPHHLKRGHKLREFSPDSTMRDCLDWIDKCVEFKHEPLFRWWAKDGKTIIDYGNYNAYIVIHHEFEEMRL